MKKIKYEDLLDYFDERYKFIAVDKSGEVYIYEDRPILDEDLSGNYWSAIGLVKKPDINIEHNFNENNWEESLFKRKTDYSKYDGNMVVVTEGDIKFIGFFCISADGSSYYLLSQYCENGNKYNSNLIENNINSIEKIELLEVVGEKES